MGNLLYTLPTTQYELDEAIERAYKKINNDKLENMLLSALLKDNHEKYVKMMLNDYILYMDNWSYSKKIKEIETTKTKEQYKDYFSSGFHSLIDGRFSFYAYKFLIPQKIEVDRNMFTNWIHIVFFRGLNKGLRYHILHWSYTNKLEYSKGIEDVLYDEVLSKIYLKDEYERRYLTFTERRNLRSKGHNLTDSYKKLMDDFI